MNNSAISTEIKLERKKTKKGRSQGGAENKTHTERKFGRHKDRRKGMNKSEAVFSFL